MEQETRINENKALYSQWVRMWNGELELCDHIIGDEFVVHLTADCPQPQVEIRDADAVRAWVGARRSHIDTMTYDVKEAPSVSATTVMAYWRATTGPARTPHRAASDVAKVGVDVLRIANGKFVECWTANISARASAA